MSVLIRRAAVAAAFFGIAFPLLFPAPSRACLNDRDTDTLAEENRALPGMVEVITGRFERNPPLYYRMRIARVEKALALNPADFALYDDIAAAYDRLGESGKALEWMAKKREQLEIFSPQPVGVPLAQLPDRWYCYYANTGTFRVHHWLHDGADRKRIAEVKQARAEIAKAIAIKPDAHFGREMYQLQAMDWIISDGKVKGDLDSDYRADLAHFLKQDGTHPVHEGLAGLVVLGNAWESIDVFNALAYHSDNRRHGKIAYLAKLRVYELEAAGRTSLVPSSYVPRHKSGNTDSPYRIAGADRVRVKYATLRTEADEWQKARTDFMMQRLTAGRHPDTDPAFWSGYRPKPLPSLSTGAFDEWRDKTFTFTNILVTVVFYLPVGLATFVVMRSLVGWWRNRM